MSTWSAISVLPSFPPAYYLLVNGSTTKLGIPGQNLDIILETFLP